MQYDKEFKLQALELSDEIGVKGSCRATWHQVLHTCRLAPSAQGSRRKAFVGSGNKVISLSERIVALRNWKRNFRETKRANDILKGGSRFFRTKPKEIRARKRFEFISEYSSRWPVSVMCDVLHVSRDRLLQIQKESRQSQQGRCSFGSYAGNTR